MKALGVTLHKDMIVSGMGNNGGVTSPVSTAGEHHLDPSLSSFIQFSSVWGVDLTSSIQYTDSQIGQ